MPSYVWTFFFWNSLYIFCEFLLFRAAPIAYGDSQAMSLIGATAAGLNHSHSSAGSLTHWARPGMETTTSWFLVGFVSAQPQRKLHSVNFEFYSSGFPTVFCCIGNFLKNVQIKSGVSKPWPWAKSSWFYNWNINGTQPPHFLMYIAGLCHNENWVGTIETILPAKPKVLNIWPFQFLLWCSGFRIQCCLYGGVLQSPALRGR